MARIEAAIQWIAYNDDPEVLEESIVRFQVSTVLVADIFRKSPDEIARRVVKMRRKDVLNDYKGAE